MFNYLAFIHHGIKKAHEDAFSAGRELASACLEQLRALDNPEQFPPKLFILLASTAYAETERAQALLDGVHHVCEEFATPEIPLIGSTVAGVIFDQAMHNDGALLICLASRMLEAKVAFAENARNEPDAAVDTLLKQLELNFSDAVRDPNPLVNRLLFTFFPGDCDSSPGHCSPGHELHQHLRSQMRARVQIVGGGSCAGERDQAGRQFADRRLLRDSIVAARLITGFPFASSIGHGLSSTRRIYHIAELDSDRRTILRFDEGAPAEVLRLHDPGDFKLLGQASKGNDSPVSVVRLAPGVPGAVRMSSEMESKHSLEALEADAGRIREEMSNLIKWSIGRGPIDNPVGAISFHSYLKGKAGPRLDDLIADARKLIGENRPYIGAFFDGAIGSGSTGRSLFNNWCMSTICLGDELRERTPFYSGFDAMAKLSQALTHSNTLEDAITHSLDLVYRTGYPGAMLSLLLENEEGTWLAPKQAKGSRYEQVLQCGYLARRRLTEDDLFLKIHRAEASPLILNTPDYWQAEFAAYQESKILSQYVKPLKISGEDPLAFLQIDLGDIRYLDRLHATEKGVIDSLGLVVESTLMRQINGDQANIARALDAALMECLRIPNLGEALQHYIRKAIEIFNADMGNIRLARQEDKKLVLVAGTGAFYDAQRREREFLSMDDDSPSCRSFKDNSTLVVNDARNSSMFHKLAAAFQNQPVMERALKEIGSYANVIFQGERGEPLGVINLLSNRPWFFTRALVRSLNAMAQRVGFLVEHHWRQNHQRFLSQVSTVYEPMTEFDDPLSTLRDATKRCAEAANAEFANLFLWDKEIEKFVLYAQDGWEERWVKAAGYSAKDPWIGQIALKEGSKYIPDVHRFKVERKTDTLLRYLPVMFGQPPSEMFTVESLVLPLRLNEASLGALTLYRKVKPEKAGQGETFTVTDPSVLAEAANNLSVMVSGQLHLEELIWEREFHNRRDQAIKVLFNVERAEALESHLGREMMVAFRASQLSIYLWNESKEQMNWVASFDRSPGGE